jgi:peptidoglycan/xylan/chitin deacetylase (PgdA/CDA1 family)
MRSIFVAYGLLASLIGIGTAVGAECPQGALGVSRTIAIDPSEHPRVGSLQYSESLPLNDHEVVLTFDDGPLPPYTNRILDTLASECVKATFFMVGRMVQGYPSIVRRVYNEGHTVANHSQTHPFTFSKMTADQAAREVDAAHASLLAALGDPKAISPFFRIPGLLRQSSVEQYLAAHDYMTWSVDFLADDWTHIKSHEITKRAINRIEARGKGILLLHDIQPATALALPDILRELKARGFKIVHVVPAGTDRPKTVTEPEQWVARRTPEQQAWPRTLVIGSEPPQVGLVAPSPESFGIEHFGESTCRVALVQTFERPSSRAGEAAPDSITAWPAPPAYTASSAMAAVLPVPAAYNFRYARPFRLGVHDKHKIAHHRIAPRKPAARPSIAPKDPAKDPAKDPSTIGTVPPAPAPSPAAVPEGPPRPPRPIGHQLSALRPPAHVGAQTR